MKNTNVLVTGGAGLIGANLVKRLVKLGANVKVIDNLWRGKIENLYDCDGRELINLTANFHNIDLTTVGALEPYIEDVDYIYHLADVVAGIKYVFSNQGDIFRQNNLINSNVIDTIKKTNIKGFIYTGTACSFPDHLQTGIDSPPLREEDQYPASPESAYGWSKLMGEYEALMMEKEHGVPVSILSLHNVYGSPCDFDDERGQVIPSLIRKAINYPRQPFTVWGSGQQGRAFVHTTDVVNALIACIPNGFGKGVIQIGPGNCTSIREIAELIVKISGKSIETQYDQSKPEGDRGRRADYAKAAKILQWHPTIELEDGLRDLYRWIEKQIKINKNSNCTA